MRGVHLRTIPVVEHQFLILNNGCVHRWDRSELFVLENNCCWESMLPFADPQHAIQMCFKEVAFIRISKRGLAHEDADGPNRLPVECHQLLTLCSHEITCIIFVSMAVVVSLFAKGCVDFHSVCHRQSADDRLSIR